MKPINQSATNAYAPTYRKSSFGRAGLYAPCTDQQSPPYCSVNCRVKLVNDTVERETGTATIMLTDVAANRQITVGGGKGYDTRSFVEACRKRRITSHVATIIRVPAAVLLTAALPATLGTCY